MINILQITLWPLERGNNKVNSIKNYHCLPNKTQAISGKDRGSHDMFVKNVKNVSTC